MSDATLTPSPFVGAIEPITETDDEIRAALEDAEIPPLLPALAYLTGDLSLLRDDLRPDPLLIAMPQGGLTEEQLATARDARARGAHPLPRRRLSARAARRPTTTCSQIMEYAVGGAGHGATYLPLLEEELAVPRRGPARARMAQGRHRARRRLPRASSSARACRACSPRTGCSRPASTFVIVEKNDDVGGTWFENTYPGCRVDNPNHNYSYSFAQRHDWPLHFSTQDVLLDYFRRCADAFDLRDHIRFRTEVRVRHVVRGRPALDGRRCERPTATRGDDRRRTPSISAVGQLNRPSFPDIAGRDSFAGRAFHSARWDHDVDLRGQARRGDRHRRERGAVHPRDRARASASCSCSSARRRGSARPPDYHDAVSPGHALALRARAVVQRVEPVLDLLADGRRRARRASRVDPDWEPKDAVGRAR